MSEAAERVSRRDFLAAFGGALLAGCGRPRGSGYPGYALVATAGDPSVAVVDLMEFRLLPPIPLGAPPAAVIPGADGAAFVLTPSTGSIHKIARASTVVGQVRVAPELSAVRMTGNGESLLAIAAATSELAMVDPKILAVRRRHALHEKPRHLDLSSGDTSLVAISSGETGLVELIDLRSNGRWSRRFPGAIGDLRFRADAQLLLVANHAGRSLTALSVPKLEEIADLPLAMQPDNLCFNRDGGQLFVSGAGMDGVAIVFPYRVLQVDQTVLAGRDPGVMACSENPALLFVASASGSDVCILHIDSRKVVGLVDVAQHPAFLTITPDDQYALVLNSSSGDMGFIRIPIIRLNPAVTRGKSGAALFTMLSVGRHPVHAAVVPRTE